MDVIGFAVELQQFATPARCEVSKYRPKSGEDRSVDATSPVFRDEH